jgi:hypothetical protein
MVLLRFWTFIPGWVLVVLCFFVTVVLSFFLGLIPLPAGSTFLPFFWFLFVAVIQRSAGLVLFVRSIRIVHSFRTAVRLRLDGLRSAFVGFLCCLLVVFWIYVRVLYYSYLLADWTFYWIMRGLFRAIRDYLLRLLAVLCCGCVCPVR